ncbi:MAG: RNA 2',3'-cyclic phosphodiesterase [Thermodesulfobacteriota bacterium]|nr:RNA 2',3'-cyclic phosphodiesterase [Thermodesulfobacteriota bacterium]
MKARLFLAFELPMEIKILVTRVSEELRQSTLDLKWVKVDNIHLTVFFMGHIKTDDIQPIRDEIQKVCLKQRSFSIQLNGMGCFPNRRNPRVLWLSIAGDLERMSHFRDALQKYLIPFGVKQERRRFKPHLTLGRFRRSKNIGLPLDEFLMKYKEMTSPNCLLSELVLFKSDLKPNGAEYTKMEAWPLRGDN